jgi:hypothetical protein
MTYSKPSNSAMQTVRLAAVSSILALNTLWPTQARIMPCQTCDAGGCRAATDHEPRWACCQNESGGTCNFCCGTNCDTFCS